MHAKSTLSESVRTILSKLKDVTTEEYAQYLENYCMEMMYTCPENRKLISHIIDSLKKLHEDVETFTIALDNATLDMSKQCIAMSFVAHLGTLGIEGSLIDFIFTREILGMNFDTAVVSTKEELLILKGFIIDLTFALGPH